MNSKPLPSPSRLDPYRILIVDDIAAVRESLRWLIENESDLLVVGEAGNGLEATRYVETLCPDLVLMDVEMPLSDGCEAAQIIRRLQHPPDIIFLSIHSVDDLADRLCEGDCLVHKSEGWPVLLHQIRVMQTKS